MTENQKREKNLGNIGVFKRVYDISYADQICMLSKSHFKIPEYLESLVDQEKNTLSQKGFLIDKLSKDLVTEWILNKKNYIFIIETPDYQVIAFCLIMGDSQIVKDILEKVVFKDVKYKKFFQTNDCLYLKQVAIDLNHVGKNVGTHLINHTLNSIDKPLVSFVIKSPLTNMRSLYFHLKNRFNYFGEFTDKNFIGFKNYRSIGLLSKPGNSVKNKEETLILMRKIIQNNDYRLKR